MQLSIPGSQGLSPAIRRAIADLASDGTHEERGAVFTAGPVVDFILDLVGYRVGQNLQDMRLLEPSAGEGDFLIPAVKRLIASYFTDGHLPGEAFERLRDAVTAIELHRASAQKLKSGLVAVLRGAGVDTVTAVSLVDAWVHIGDFLLIDLEGPFDLVIGNPPYVRQERIPNDLLKEYRRRFSTMYDRADLYVPFYERSLDLLAPEGRVGFICANRWLKNKYGGPLRAKVAKGFALDVFVDVDGSAAFDRAVDAYPGITVIRRGEGRGTQVVRRPSLEAKSLRPIARRIASANPSPSPDIAHAHNVAQGADPWLLDSPDVLSVLRSLEARFPTMEEDGCRVTIGVATGCDRVFIGPFDELPVEDERKLPLVKAPDIRSGEVRWGGKGIINPFLKSGDLASFQDFPRFGAYLESHGAALRKRHVAKKTPARWYRTIDRIYPDLTATPKLLIPDIKGDATIVYDEGHFYPHHNLYVITSNTWDLQALQAILRSSISLMFVAAYGVRMAGGFLRFQAQYLRRIRIPSWGSLTLKQRARLVQLGSAAGTEEIDAFVLPLFGLGETEKRAIVAFAAANRAQGG